VSRTGKESADNRTDLDGWQVLFEAPVSSLGYI
jgi:hypothetical protein